MSQIAVINRSAAADVDVAFWAEAWNVQAREVAAIHSVPYTPVAFYSSPSNLPADCRILTIQGQINQPGALGYHTDDLGVVFAVVLYTGPDTSTTGSHEVCEEIVDPTVDRWMPFDADHEQAFEVCDRVESDFYPIAVSVLGETRAIRVANYLLPSAFDPAGVAPFDKMGRLTKWNAMTAGGYFVARNITSGKVEDVFMRDKLPMDTAQVVSSDSMAMITVAQRMGRRGSRLLRRLRT